MNKWQVESHADTPEWFYVFRFEDGAQNIIASDLKSREEAEAIALRENTRDAAPDLLNALEIAEATIVRLAKTDSANGTLDVVRAAIAKAKQ